MHHKFNYVGVPRTLVALGKRSWVPQGNAVMEKVVHHNHMCCCRWHAKTLKLQFVPNPPCVRVSRQRPTEATVLDYAGPIIIRENRATDKQWIAVLTYLTVRAVHLDLVKDRSALSFSVALAGLDHHEESQENLFRTTKGISCQQGLWYLKIRNRLRMVTQNGQWLRPMLHGKEGVWKIGWS